MTLTEKQSCTFAAAVATGTWLIRIDLHISLTHTRETLSHTRIPGHALSSFPFHEGVQLYLFFHGPAQLLLSSRHQMYKNTQSEMERQRTEKHTYRRREREKTERKKEKKMKKMKKKSKKVETARKRGDGLEDRQKQRDRQTACARARACV